MFKFLLGSEPIFLLVRTVSPQIRTKRPLYFDLAVRDLVLHPAARAGARESCADFRASVWDFNPKPE